MYKIRYCSQWNYKPQAEALSVELNNNGYRTVIEEGATGEFTLWKGPSYIKGAGNGVFFDFEDIKELLNELSTTTS